MNVVMRSTAVVLIALIVHATVGCAAQVPPPDSVAVVGGRLYTSPGAAPLEDATVIVRNGVITDVGPRRSIDVPDGMRTIDATGKVIMAGFQNSHVHFTEAKWNDAGTQAAPALDAQLSAMLLRYGFTTVVDTGSSLPNTVALRGRIESRDVVGPRILTAGLPQYPPDGIPYYIRDLPPELLTLLPQPATPAEAVAAARENLDGGADILKLFTGSWISRERVLPMPEDVAAAAVAEAHRRGKLVFTHPSNVPGLEVALRARVDVLAHAVENTTGFTDDHLGRMVAQKMSLIPTLHLLAGAYNIEDIRREVVDFHRAGGQVLFGTDVGYLTDYDPANEYAALGRAGLQWSEILASLTTNPAARFGESSRRGRVAKGMDGDLVVTARDPAADVRALADVAAVVRAGRVVFQRP
jgi:imidazolonepropionase-like amidohydrolase